MFPYEICEIFKNTYYGEHMQTAASSITTFEIEIKGALEVTTELHLKMHMVVYFLLQKSARNNSIKDKLEEASLLCMNVHLRFHFKRHRNLQKCEEKDAFDVAVGDPLDSEIKGAPLNLKFGSYASLYHL